MRFAPNSSRRFVAAGDRGLTCDEFEVILKARHQTVSGAITALKGMDLIRPKVDPADGRSLPAGPGAGGGRRCSSPPRP